MKQQFDHTTLPALAFDWGINNGAVGFLNGIVRLLEALIVPFTLIIQLFASIFGSAPEEDSDTGGE